MISLRHITLTLLALTCFTSCYSEADLEAQKQKFSDLREKHRNLQSGAETLFAKHTADISAAMDALSEAEADMDSVEASLQNGKLEIETLREEFVAYRKTFREHRYASLSQHTFATLKTGEDGTKKNVTISGIRKGQFHYQSESGRGRFPTSKIPEDLRTYLLLDEEAADLDAFPEIVSAPIILPEAPVGQPSEGAAPSAQEIGQAAQLYEINEHTKKMDRLVDRRIELEASQEILKIKLSTLQTRRLQHTRNVRDHGSYESKRAIRSIEALEKKMRARSKQLQIKLVTLHSIISKARL